MVGDPIYASLHGIVPQILTSAKIRMCLIPFHSTSDPADTLDDPSFFPPCHPLPLKAQVLLWT